MFKLFRKIYFDKTLLAGVLTSILLAFPLKAQETAAQEDELLKLSLQELLSLKVESASGFSETLDQTPVPVTVITQSMIEQSGVQTIRDLLIQYVPGFTPVQDQNEYNVAFRGVYSSSQQKVLFLLNGKRMNSRAYSSAAPDYSIALDKLKQIEVIRGPGSSLYGNVALTAVVNLVLKQADHDTSVKTALKVGEHGQIGSYLQLSGRSDEVKYFSWINFFQSDGEIFAITPQEDFSATPALYARAATLDGFKDNPAVDVGVNLEGGDWTALLNYRRSHYIEPFSAGGVTGEAYDYSDFPHVYRSGPGAEASWFQAIGHRTFDISESEWFKLDLNLENSRVGGLFVLAPQNDRFGAVRWRDRVLGVNLEYQKIDEKSALSAGVQYEGMEVTDSEFVTGQDGVLTDTPFNDENPVLVRGKETVSSAYIQFKREINESWLVNVGGRYDYKDRHTGKNISEFSPRVAVIFNGKNNSIKFSYSRSFVDPPFWNRYSALPTFRGSVDLNPEILESFQITPEFLMLGDSLSLKLNLFFNDHHDFVFRNNQATSDEPIYTNAGQMETRGLEQEWRYHANNYSLSFISTYQQVSSFEFYEARDESIFNIPQWQHNLTWTYFPSQQTGVQISANHLGKRLSPINIAVDGQTVIDPFPGQGAVFFKPDNYLPAVTLLNLGVNWRLKEQPMEIRFKIQNLTDKEWTQGGSTVHPYPQTGRWSQISFLYHW